MTTLATVLALVWPGEPVLVEADPSGGDLSMRMHAPGTQYLSREPTMLTLATAVRSGARGDSLPGYAQETSLGIAVIPGPPIEQAWTSMLPLWAQVATGIKEWPGTVIADLGRLQSGHPGLPLVQAADVVVLLTTATVDGLFHARERARELEQILAADGGPGGRVGVVVRTGGKAKGALNDVSLVLQNLVPVIGGFADDRSGVETLMAGSDTVHLRGSPLMRSGSELVARIGRLLPTAGAGPAPAPAPGSPVRVLRDAR